MINKDVKNKICIKTIYEYLPLKPSKSDENIAYRNAEKKAKALGGNKIVKISDMFGVYTFAVF